ncbi:MAG: acetylxylan esterase [Candidatus Sumerlaeaceae bacterium]|nr:acetylxylan esterase [Candidatus Sumerlaeaceae bacterium]
MSTGQLFIIVITCFLLSMTTAVSAGSWSLSVDPAVRHGRPAVIATAETETTESVVITIRAIDGDSSRVLVEKSLHPTHHPIRVEAPKVPHPTTVEFSVTTASLATPFFAWRTVALPKSTRLIDYRGRRNYPVPSDFDVYWKQAKADLAKVPLEPTIERVPDKDTSSGLLYKVILPSVGGTKIVCWYYVPRDAFDEQRRVRSTYPAVIIMPGYGAEEPPIDRTSSGIITLSVNPRHHGPSREFWKAPVEHMLWNIHDPDQFYYRYAFMDCLRAAEFLFARAEVDHSCVAAEGGSQGGLFALALGALEPRIACVVSNVTAFSAFDDGMLLSLRGHQLQYARLLQENPTSASTIRRSLAYIDGANLATRIRCPVQINMGDIDPVCNYVTGIVIYNQLPAGVPREYNVVANCGHAVPPPMRELNWAWFKRWLKVR